MFTTRNAQEASNIEDTTSYFHQDYKQKFLKDKQAIERWLLREVAEILKVAPDKLDRRKEFVHYGLDSLQTMTLIEKLAALLERPLSASLPWDYPSIETLAQHVACADEQSVVSAESFISSASEISEPIAIIGLSCRFPGAPNADAFWKLLCAGEDAITRPPSERWDVATICQELGTTPEQSGLAWGGFLDNVDQFDAQFFGISPREATAMDPQQRLVLEVAWEALEDAGQSVDALSGSQTGVFMGVWSADYLRRQSHYISLLDVYTATGNASCIVANRLSYALNFHGPSLTIDTACSSSLAAVHLACQSLRNGETTLALAGGVNLILTPESTLALSRLSVLSPDGRCKAFAADANGYVRSEGVGVVVLKRLSQAQSDGDTIYALVRGSTLISEGASNGLTAPSRQAQEAMLLETYRRSQISPDQIHYVETHGTGTILGDSIEAHALGNVLGAQRSSQQPCLIGSVKTNIGHLESAAGIAGFIKVALALKHKVIPPNLHFTQPSPHISFEQLGLKVVDAISPWPDTFGQPARAGVSSNGFGGAAAHLVLEEAPLVITREGLPYIIPLAAESLEGLQDVIKTFLQVVKTTSGELLELVHSLYLQADAGRYRQALVVYSREDLCSQLEGLLAAPKSPSEEICQTLPRRLVFVCSGQGSQWWAMGRELLEREPVFSSVIVECDLLAHRYINRSLLAELTASEKQSHIHELDIAPPALFAIQIALAALWRSWGIIPDAVVGHSIGEVAAAYIAGILTLPEAMHIICTWGLVTKRCKGRGLLAVVELASEQIWEVLADFSTTLSLASINSPTSCVIAGDPATINQAQSVLQGQQIFCQLLKMEYAPHSAQMDDILADFVQALQDIQLRPATIPFFSTVFPESDESLHLDAAYWAANLRQPVQFAATIKLLIDSGFTSFLELGPHPILTRALQQMLAHQHQVGSVWHSLQRGTAAYPVLLNTLADLYAHGWTVAWSRALQAIHPPEPQSFLLPLSARSPEALRDLVLAYQEQARQYCTENRSVSTLCDVCYTASLHRSHHQHRATFLVRSWNDLVEQTQAFLEHTVLTGLSSGRAQTGQRDAIVFVFPGQGSEWLGMGRTLFEQEPVFRAALERCDQCMRVYEDWSLLEVLLHDESDVRLESITVVQPILFAVEIALATLWRSWGIEPDIVIGHSMGEVAAAYIAGILNLEDAIKIICCRSNLLKRICGLGKMAVVNLSLEAARQVIVGYEGRLSIAACNSPTSTVLAGDASALQQVIQLLEQKDVFCRLLKADVASHSPQVEPLLADLTVLLRNVQPQTAAIPLLSTVTGEYVQGSDLQGDYWARNLHLPVLFSTAVQKILQERNAVFLEISPHPTLLNAIQTGLQAAERQGYALSSLRKEQDERMMLLTSLGTLYTQGQLISWQKLYPSGGQRVPLPAYPFQRESFWLALNGERQGDTALSRQENGQAHPLLGTLIRTMLAPHGYTWEKRLHCQNSAYLYDHRVRDTGVMPGTGYIEMALTAGQLALGPGSYALQEVAFQRAMFLPDQGARIMQVVLSPSGDNEMHFQVYSVPEEQRSQSATWTLHAQGRISRVQWSPETDALFVEDLESIQSRCLDVQTAATHYEQMQQLGIQYGPAFQGVQRVWRRDGEALALVHSLEHTEGDYGRYFVHPALLDACLQVMYPCFPAHIRNSPYLPIAIEKLYFYTPPTPEMWSHIRFYSNEEQANNILAGDWRLYDQQGHMVMEAHNVRFQRLERNVSLSDEGRIPDWLYELQWLPIGADSDLDTTTPDLVGNWVIFADALGVGDFLAQRLRNLGACCTLVTRDGSKGDSDRQQVFPTWQEDFHHMLASLTTSISDCTNIVFLWSLDTLSPEQLTCATLDEAQEISCNSVLYLIQQLVEVGWLKRSKLWLVTQGAQVTDNHRDKINLAQAPLWGLGRVIELEYPELWGSLIDLDPIIVNPDTLAEELLATISQPVAETQLVLRDGQRYTARLQSSRLPEETQQPIIWHPDGTYLITGGLGGLGLNVARWMVAQGARRLVLLSRSKLPPRTNWSLLAENEQKFASQIAALQELEAQGATIMVFAVDVSDETRMRALFETLRATLPPIRGILHAAGVLTFETLPVMTSETFTRVIKPKVHGSWLLHLLTRDLPLDFFITFTSPAAIWGSKGQGHYAAANHFLDALAFYRQAQGLPVLNVGWGPWAEAGMVAQEDIAHQMSLQGLRALSTEQGLLALSMLLNAHTFQRTVANVDWENFKALYEAQSYRRKLLADIQVEQPSIITTSSALRVPMRVQLLQASSQERTEIVALRVKGLVGQTFRMSPARLDLQSPLNALGLDSLMAMELKHAFEANLGVQISVVRFLKNPTVAQLIAEIVQELLIETAPKPVDVIRSIEHQTLIPMLNGEIKLPLSFGQRGLWFIHQLAPTSPAYNVIFAVRIHSSLTIPALERAFQALLDRHPSLRTTFEGTATDVKQSIHAAMPIPFRQWDATDWSQVELDERLVQEAHCPFDLQQGPLFRVDLFLCGDTEYILLLNAHHIVIDFWSLTILIKELGEVYQAEITGRPVSLPSLPLHYQDFVYWQSAMLESPRGETLWKYWQQQLLQPLPTLDLPIEGSRPPIQSYRGASQMLEITPALTADLKHLSEQKGVTLYMLLLTTFMVLLYRLSGQEDIVVGTPTAGRNQAEVMNVVGYFVNMLPMRANLAGKPSFAELLQRIRRVALEAFEHQDYPFSLMVERLQEQRDPSRSPLFQVVFVLQKAYHLHEEGLTTFSLNEPGAHLNLNELHLESLVLKQHVAQFDLTCSIVETAGGLLGSFEYNIALFSPETIQQMTRQYVTLLENSVLDPEQPINRLPLLTQEEQHRILVQWNTTDYPYSLKYCVQQIVEQQAAVRPTALAAHYAETTFCYGDLNAKANQLAHYLQNLGVGPEVRVGICVTPSFEMLVGILAILKAGGAYVPLDPDYPLDRKTFMLKDAQVPVVLTQEYLKPGLPESSDWIMLCLDSDWEACIGDLCTNNLPEQALPENLAYVIYTSGSTGRPKGVEISHGSLLNLVTWHQHTYEVTAADRATQLAGFGFDAAVWEIWPYLCAGASLHFPDMQTRLSPPHLKDWLLAREITISFLPTPLAESVLEEPWPARTTLRALLTGGDRLHTYPASTLPFPLINHYGPTESTVVTSAGLVPPSAEATRLPSLGRPIANIQVYVLDTEFQPVSCGSVGELFIGGLSLARGYLNRSDLTAAQFIPNPFAREAGQRLYKTGDLVRYLLDGALEFIGRYDQQIKIRGVRIELGEIEALLAQHPLVREHIVVANDDHKGEKRLLAYVVPRSEGLTANELRSYVKERLPHYMVPAAILFLKEFPITQNGKVDRAALPDVAAANPVKERRVTAPTNELERKLVAIWEDILSIQTVGIYDSFFDLGGHSLLLLKMCDRVRTITHHPLSIVDLFQYTTIHSLGAYLETEHQEQTHLQKRVERAQIQRQLMGEKKMLLKKGKKNHE